MVPGKRVESFESLYPFTRYPQEQQELCTLPGTRYTVTRTCYEYILGTESYSRIIETHSRSLLSACCSIAAYQGICIYMRCASSPKGQTLWTEAGRTQNAAERDVQMPARIGCARVRLPTDGWPISADLLSYGDDPNAQTSTHVSPYSYTFVV